MHNEQESVETAPAVRQAARKVRSGKSAQEPSRSMQTRSMASKRAASPGKPSNAADL
jgi:hypothetical protein